MTLYKATRVNGRDFRTDRIDYAGALERGEDVIHPCAVTGLAMEKDRARTYFSLSDTPGEALTGGSWPARLFEAQAAGEVIASSCYSFKVCTQQVRLVREVPAHLALGPRGEEVTAFLRELENAGQRLSLHSTENPFLLLPLPTEMMRCLRGGGRLAAWEAVTEYLRDDWLSLSPAPGSGGRLYAIMCADLLSGEDYDRHSRKYLQDRDGGRS